MEVRRRPRGDKVYRGAYNYYKGEKMYAQEEFEVYKDRKELGLTFFAEFHSRVATGELLKIYLDYTLTKEFIPVKLQLEKTLGEHIVKEYFDYNSRTNKLDYIFIGKDTQTHKEIQVPPKFSISTPVTSTSMLFLRTKKEDTTAKNYYQVLSSTNQWSYKEDPFPQTMAAERTALAQEHINIEGQSVTATQYKVWDYRDIEKVDDLESVPYALASMSKYVSLPYKIYSPSESIKIQIKYLNDLDKD